MAQAAQQQVVQPEPQDPPPQPVEVDIGEEVVVETPEAKTPPPAPRPKPRHEERIHRIASERDEARTYAANLQRELEQSRREAAQAKADKETAERAGMTNYAARVDSDVAAAKLALKAAMEAKDDDAVVEANTALAKAMHEVGDVNAWRATQPKDGEQPQAKQPEPRQEQRQEAPQYVPPPEPVRNFMVENSWFSAVQLDDGGNPVKQNGQFVQNPDFDEEMHEEAMTEHRRIAREVRFGRLTKDFINSPEYFARIQDRVAKEFPDAFEGGEEEEQAPAPRSKTPPMAPARQPVAPTQRQSQPGTPPKQGTKMKLDGEQTDFVRRLVDNGTMLYPRTHSDAAKRGQKMSYDDAFVEYAKKLKADPGSQQNR